MWLVNERDPSLLETGLTVVGRKVAVEAGKLDLLSGYLAAAHGLPINVVTFQVFHVGDGQRLLLRELTEAETAPHPRTLSLTAADICQRADAEGSGALFRQILTAAHAAT